MKFFEKLARGLPDYTIWLVSFVVFWMICCMLFSMGCATTPLIIERTLVESKTKAGLSASTETRTESETSQVTGTVVIPKKVENQAPFSGEGGLLVIYGLGVVALILLPLLYTAYRVLKAFLITVTGVVAKAPGTVSEVIKEGVKETMPTWLRLIFDWWLKSRGLKA